MPLRAVTDKYFIHESVQKGIQKGCLAVALAAYGATSKNVLIQMVAINTLIQTGVGFLNHYIREPKNYLFYCVNNRSNNPFIRTESTFITALFFTIYDAPMHAITSAVCLLPACIPLQSKSEILQFATIPFAPLILLKRNYGKPSPIPKLTVQQAIPIFVAGAIFRLIKELFHERDHRLFFEDKPANILTYGRLAKNDLLTQFFYCITFLSRRFFLV